MQNTEAKIRERAYHLWIANGRREGEADKHWLTAEREVIAGFAASAPAATASAPAKTGKARGKVKPRAA